MRLCQAQERKISILVRRKLVPESRFADCNSAAPVINNNNLRAKFISACTQLGLKLRGSIGILVDFMLQKIIV